MCVRVQLGLVLAFAFANRFDPQICEADADLRPAALECFDAMHSVDRSTNEALCRFAPLLAPAEVLEISMRHCTKALHDEHCEATPATQPRALYFDGHKVHRGRARQHGVCVFLTLQAPDSPRTYDVDDTTTAARMFVDALDPRSWCSMGPNAQYWAIACQLRRIVEEAHQRGYRGLIRHEHGGLTIIRQAAEAYERYLIAKKRGVVDSQVVDAIVSELLPDPRNDIRTNHHMMGGGWKLEVPKRGTIQLDTSPFRRWRSWVIPAQLDGNLDGLKQVVLTLTLTLTLTRTRTRTRTQTRTRAIALTLTRHRSGFPGNVGPRVRNPNGIPK